MIRGPFTRSVSHFYLLSVWHGLDSSQIGAISWISRRVRANPRRYRCALSFRICHVPSRSDENETTVAGNCIWSRAKGIRATRGRKPAIKRDTARSARWWILYAYQSLNYTYTVGFAHVILSEAVYAIRAINILVSDWDITRGIACTRIYDREPHRQKL